jgi:hypothetical protein
MLTLGTRGADNRPLGYPGQCNRIPSRRRGRPRAVAPVDDAARMTSGPSLDGKD